MKLQIQAVRTITESDLYTTIITQKMLIAHELGNFTKSLPVIVTLTMSLINSRMICKCNTI